MRRISRRMRSAHCMRVRARSYRSYPSGLMPSRPPMSCKCTSTALNRAWAVSLTGGAAYAVLPCRGERSRVVACL